MTADRPATLIAYRAATSILQPFAPALLRRRLRRGKEDGARLDERLGRPSLPRPDGALAWLHGASVGESTAILPLVGALADRGTKVLVTSGTRTSAEILGRRLPPGARHQFLPLDGPAFAARFLDHWRPDLALFAESEIWPNLISELAERGIPLALVNARLSERSLAGWLRAPRFAGAVFGRIALALPQSGPDGDRLRRLGTPVGAVTGNLKFDIAPLPADPQVVERLAGRLAGRAVWMAASTHPGEEEAVIAAHRALAGRRPDLLTILAPRHPDRRDEVADLAALSGLRLARRSAGEVPGPDHALFLVDTIGELGLFYRLAPLVFMGGSLVPHGGQNPIEPSRLGAAILHGPAVHNFSDVYAALDRDEAAGAVHSPAELSGAVDELLDRPDRMRAMVRRAGTVLERLGGALGRTMEGLAPLLPPARPPGEAIW